MGKKYLYFRSIDVKISVKKFVMGKNLIKRSINSINDNIESYRKILYMIFSIVILGISANEMTRESYFAK